MKNITNTTVQKPPTGRVATPLATAPSEGRSSLNPNCPHDVQLGLCLSSPPPLQVDSSRRRRFRRLVNHARARFWFGQMRRMVDAAVEWKPVPLPPAQQTVLDLHRPMEVAVKGS